VEKYGKPNGVIGFSGVSLADRVFDEPATGNLSIVFPITRSRGTAGNITVRSLRMLLLLQIVKRLEKLFRTFIGIIKFVKVCELFPKTFVKVC